MNLTLEQKADICFDEVTKGIKIPKGLQRVEGMIEDAYLHKRHFLGDASDLGLMFQVSYGTGGGIMRCTDMKQIAALMDALGVTNDKELIGKTVQVYLNRTKEGIVDITLRDVAALSKYQYDL